MIVFSFSNVCTANNVETIGSKILDIGKFVSFLKEAVENHDTSQDRVIGQHFIVLPKEAYGTVSSGTGLKTKNPDDYVIRNHREGPKMFLKRAHASKVKSLAVVVYTREAYMNDPDYDPAEAKSIGEATHIIVAVLAGDGKPSPVTPYRFVHNLAGGNKEYIFENKNSFPEYEELFEHYQFLVLKAKEVKEYWDKHSVVAD